MLPILPRRAEPDIAEGVFPAYRSGMERYGNHLLVGFVVLCVLGTGCASARYREAEAKAGKGTNHEVAERRQGDEVTDLVQRLKWRAVKVLLDTGGSAPVGSAGLFEFLASGVVVVVDKKTFVISVAHFIPTGGIPPGRVIRVSVPRLKDDTAYLADLAHVDQARDVAVLRVRGAEIDDAQGLDVEAVNQVPAGEVIVALGYSGASFQDVDPEVKVGKAAIAVFRNRSTGELFPFRASGGTYQSPPDSENRPGTVRVLLVLGADIHEGMSGGPAFSLATGKLVGINQARFSNVRGHDDRLKKIIGAGDGGLIADVSWVMRVIRGLP